MNFYISDTHFGHENIIRHCQRPFSSVEEMDRQMIENWNSRVGSEDTVYILGDMMFRNKASASSYLERLNGKKHLIVGNHDRTWMPRCPMDKYFESVDNLLYISDCGRQIVMCHYPMMSWPHMERGSYMVYGHIHNSTGQPFWQLIKENPYMLNAGADVNCYMPVTFEEMVAYNKAFKAER